MAKPEARGEWGPGGEPLGVVVVDKPRGITSHAAVQEVRRITHIKRVGHVGTLDPAARGVLPLLVGKATRLSRFATGAEVAPDLRHARVYVSLLAGEDEWEEVHAGLVAATPYLRARLGKMMRVKRIPELDFRYDTSLAEGTHMDALLDELDIPDDSTTDDSEDDDG